MLSETINLCASDKVPLPVAPRGANDVTARP